MSSLEIIDKNQSKVQDDTSSFCTFNVFTFTLFIQNKLYYNTDNSIRHDVSFVSTDLLTLTNFAKNDHNNRMVFLFKLINCQ